MTVTLTERLRQRTLTSRWRRARSSMMFDRSENSQSAAARHGREREGGLVASDMLSASIAHAVRQPLSAMITNASACLHWLNRIDPDLDEVKAALRRIVAEGRHAGAVIENIQALCTNDARTWTSLDMNDLIRKTLALVRGNLETHGTDVQTEADEELPRIRGDQVQLQQVLINLMTNAIDAMACADGERVLWVRSQAYDSGNVLVTIEDNGSGIEPGTMDRIFDLLFTTKAHGMGMGLPICRSIIDAHGGRLWATANRPRGAIFQFTVPADLAHSGSSS